MRALLDSRVSIPSPGGLLLLRPLSIPSARSLNAVTGTLDDRFRLVLLLLYVLDASSRSPRSNAGVVARPFDILSSDPRLANTPANFSDIEVFAVSRAINGAPLFRFLLRARRVQKKINAAITAKLMTPATAPTTVPASTFLLCWPSAAPAPVPAPIVLAGPMTAIVGVTVNFVVTDVGLPALSVVMITEVVNIGLPVVSRAETTDSLTTGLGNMGTPLVCASGIGWACIG